MDRGRNRLSTRESRATQKGQESQGAGGARLPVVEQGFLGRKGVHPKEGREHKVTKVEMYRVWGWSVADACVFTASRSGVRSLEFRWYTVRSHCRIVNGERALRQPEGSGLELESWQSVKKWLEGGGRGLVPGQTGVGTGRLGRKS